MDNLIPFVNNTKLTPTVNKTEIHERKKTNFNNIIHIIQTVINTKSICMFMDCDCTVIGKVDVMRGEHKSIASEWMG